LVFSAGGVFSAGFSDTTGFSSTAAFSSAGFSVSIFAVSVSFLAVSVFLLEVGFTGDGRVDRRGGGRLAARREVLTGLAAVSVSVEVFSTAISGEGDGFASAVSVSVSVAGRGMVAPTELKRLAPLFSVVSAGSVFVASATGMPPVNRSKVPPKRI
jgi:hypothetical protein